jgi:uncharacterized protein with PQ loop repeat
MDIWTLISWIAAIAGTIYPIFQLRKAVEERSAEGISRKFLITWMVDKTATFALMVHLENIPMSIKYAFGLVCVASIAYFKFWGRK